MKLIKPKFWGTKKSVFPYVLLPITFTLMLIIWIKKKITRVLKFKIKVICIGNIYLGGTGKTPLSIFLAKEISKIGKKTAIIRKFYKNHIDEYKLIEKNYSYLITEKNRVDGINKAIKRGFDTVILDDGFQDYKINKDFNILCFNENQLIGNGFVIPSGPLRETLNSIENVKIIIINGKKNEIFEKKIKKYNKEVSFYYSNYNLKNTEKFKNEKLIAIAGIGNPENFFKLLQDNNLDVKEKLVFPDHFLFKKSEIEKIIKRSKEKNYKIIMTEKDFCRIKDYNYSNIDYAEVDLIINQKEKLLNDISKIYDKIS